MRFEVYVKKGSKLTKADLAYLKENVTSAITSVIFTNLGGNKTVKHSQSESIRAGEKILLT